MKKISVIIPCYNAQAYIPRCLHSIFSQTIGMETMEIILVNDASTDHTLDILLQFENKFPDSVIVVNLEQNIRQGGARNVGLSYSSGEYVAFLDADDWIHPDFYSTLYSLALKYDTDIIQYPTTDCTLDAEEREEKSCIHHNSKGNGYYEINSIIERKQFLNSRILNYGSQVKFYKRSFLLNNQSSFMEGVAYEEPSFVYPLLFTAQKIYIFDKPWYYCHIHKESTMQSYVRQKGKLYDHPRVQLFLFNIMRNKRQIYQCFQSEIDYYFLFTFYYETLYFAVSGHLYLGLDFFQMMQDTIKQLLPEWQHNSYINLDENKDVLSLLSTVDIEFNEVSFKTFLNEIASHIS